MHPSNQTVLIALQGRSPELSPILRDEQSTRKLFGSLPATRAFTTGIYRILPKAVSIELPEDGIKVEVEGSTLSIQKAFLLPVGESLFELSNERDVVISLICEADGSSVDQVQAEVLVGSFLGPSEQRGARLRELFGIKDPALANLLNGLNNLSFAALRLSQREPQLTESQHALLHAFLIYGGMVLSRQELETDNIRLEQNGRSRLRLLLREIKSATRRLIEFHRLFLSSNQSMFSNVSLYCETILQLHKIRDRHSEQSKFTQDVADYLSISYQESSIGFFMSVQVVLGLSTVFGIPLAVFFGLFSISTKAEIIRAGLTLLLDERVGALFAVTVAFALLAGIVIGGTVYGYLSILRRRAP